jgi:hypothetical protein
MTQLNPYQPPSAHVEDPQVDAGARADRKKLIPKWIKVFGWIFVVAGAIVPISWVFAAATQMLGSYEVFGIKYYGPAHHPIAILVAAIFVALAVSAYGLLFGKSWGVHACLATGYLSVAVCIVTMLIGLSHQSINLRLELLLLIPYLRKLHQIKRQWAAGETTPQNEA